MRPHVDELANDAAVIRFECIKLVVRDVPARDREVEPDTCLFDFPFCITQLATECLRINAFAPRLTSVSANTTRGAKDLAGECVTLLRRELPTQAKDLHRSGKCFFVNSEVSKAVNVRHRSFRLSAHPPILGGEWAAIRRDK